VVSDAGIVDEAASTTELRSPQMETSGLSDTDRIDL